MIELLKCLATGLGILTIALAMVVLALVLTALVVVWPCVGYIYIPFMILLIAVMAGWAIRNA